MINDVTKTDTHKKAMLEALTKSLGVVTIAAKEANIARQTHYEWYNEDEDYHAAVDAIADIAIDFAESKLHQQIDKGDTTATIFYLKTKGKRRGYIERSEFEHLGEVKSAIHIEVTDPRIGQELRKLLE